MGEVLATAAGVSIVAVVVWDVFVAVLHIDHDGNLAPRVHRAVWCCAMMFARRLPSIRRTLLALAGPVMMALSITLWMGLFIFGFALMVWPHLDEGFRSQDELQPLTFIDALYYSGITGTVLGHGDVTPVSMPLKVAAFVEAGLGFALLTGVITYLMNIVSGVLDRNILAVRLKNDAQQCGDGIALIVCCLSSEEISDVRQRLEDLTRGLYHVQEKMHQFPILDLYYRSLHPLRDPEPMLQTLAEAAIASQLVSRQSPGRRLQPVSESLAQAITQLMQVVAKRYLPRDVRLRLEHDEPEPEDRMRVRQIRNDLKRSLAAYFPGDGGEDIEPVVLLAFRTRIFLTQLDRLTGWRVDHPARL